MSNISLYLALKEALANKTFSNGKKLDVLFAMPKDTVYKNPTYLTLAPSISSTLEYTETAIEDKDELVTVKLLAVVTMRTIGQDVVAEAFTELDALRTEVIDFINGGCLEWPIQMSVMSTEESHGEESGHIIATSDMTIQIRSLE